METECSAKPSVFGRVEGRPVVASFDGGALTSDAGGLLLGAADRSLNLVQRLAGCFGDARDRRVIEHSVPTLIGQLVFGDPRFAARVGEQRAKQSLAVYPVGLGP